MEIMERYKIQESIKDVIAILDSAPMIRDMVPETNIVKLTNLAPIAHLAIERALKALISEAGGDAGRTHGLHKLYRALADHNFEAYEYLTRAFDDAVKFLRYNTNSKGLRQFSSLDNYLSKVGTEKAFEEFRYWAIGESSKGDSAISLISLPVHRELLWAVWIVFFPERRDTVSVRVERAVADAIQRQLLVSTEGPHIEHPATRYMRWVSQNHRTHRDAIRDLVRRGFGAIEDTTLEEGLRKAYKELQESKDPAVEYFVNTLTYLPEGSQQRNRDAVPTVEWSNQDKVNGSVLTPGGACLGFLLRQADGAWAIQPLEQGLAQFTATSFTLADAKHYLVNRLTQVVVVTSGDLCKTSRILGEGSSALARSVDGGVWEVGVEPDRERRFRFEFWDSDHGLDVGNQVTITIPSQFDSRFASRFSGSVVEVEGARIMIKGDESGVMT